MLPRRALSWLLALALLLGQAAAFAHALEHLDPHGATPDHACELCVAQAQLGGAAPGKPFVPQVIAAAFVVPAAAALPPARLFTRHAPARAPPVSA
jgi:hypothetical protein